MLSLKKVCSLGLAAALVATGLMTTAANAADGDTTGNSDSTTGTTNTKTDKTSTATFKVNANGDLTLDSVPTFDFGSVDGTDLLKSAQTLKLSNTDTTNKVQVTDTSGHGDGYWTLNARLTKAFTNKTALPGAALNLAFMAGTNSGANVFTQTVDDGTGGTTLTAGGSETPVVASDAAHTGVSTYTYNSTSAGGKSGATLSLPASSSFEGGTYTGEVTWNLTAAQ